MDKKLVSACIHGGSSLPEQLKDIFDFATAVASAPVYPTIKRALGYTQSCSLVEIEFAA